MNAVGVGRLVGLVMYKLLGVGLSNFSFFQEQDNFLNDLQQD
jgi:hypothetical protein